MLYQGTQYVLKTTDGGKSWQEISPDLTGYRAEEPKEGPRGAEGQPRRAEEGEIRRRTEPDRSSTPAITALAPSPVKAGEIWAGTSNRIVQLTRDGGKTLAERYAAGAGRA